MMVGREVSLVVDKGPAIARRGRPPGRGPLGRGRPRLDRRRGPRLRGPRRRDLRHRRRRGQWAERARRGPDRPAQVDLGGRISLAGDDVTNHSPARPVRARRRLCPRRPPPLSGWSSPSPSRTTSSSPTSTTRRTRAMASSTSRRSPSAPPSSSRSSTSAPRPARCRRSRCRAATSRSSSWPASSAGR